MITTTTDRIIATKPGITKKNTVDRKRTTVLPVKMRPKISTTKITMEVTTVNLPAVIDVNYRAVRKKKPHTQIPTKILQCRQMMMSSALCLKNKFSRG